MQPAKHRILGLAMLLAVSLPATACEPAVQMMVVFAGPSLLSIATLGFGILAKCGIFALLERSLSRKQAFAFLFLGNLYSTAIGVLVVCGMTIGIGLTALWEERVVAGLALRSRPTRGYFTSVIRANYLIFGIALLVGAIRMLPRRLNSQDFLAWLLDVFGRG